MEYAPAAVMRPLATEPMDGPLPGNLLVVGSVANIIAVGAAARRGIVIGWKRHARVGVPVRLATLAISAAWLWWCLRASAA